MSYKSFYLSILAFVLSLGFCSLFLSSDTYAASRLGSYSDYTTNIRNSSNNGSFSSTINNNQRYSAYIPAYTNGYIANGHFATNFNFTPLEEYHAVIIVSVEADCNSASTNTLIVQPEAIQLYNSNNVFRTVNDDVSITFTSAPRTGSGSSSGNSQCLYSVVHNIELEAMSVGSATIYTQSSNLLNIANNGGDTKFDFFMSSYIFQSTEEWVSFRSDLLNSLNSANSSLEDIQIDVYNIFSRLGTTNTKLDTINNSINGLNLQQQNTNSRLDDANDLQEQANQDANDRYEDEKTTIGDNSQGGIDAVDDIDTSFSLINFLGVIFGNLSVQTCYYVPTLGNLLHAPNNQYCAWFPSNVRSIMTAFIDVFVGFIVCSFTWSWVKRSGL